MVPPVGIKAGRPITYNSLGVPGAQDGNRSEAFFDGPQASDEVDLHSPGVPGAQDGNRSEAFFDGPQAWEEVDAEELERVAVNIARAAVPSTESLEVGARLAMQAAAMEAESADPLGLGRVDTRGLALVRHVQGLGSGWSEGYSYGGGCHGGRVGRPARPRPHGHARPGAGAACVGFTVYGVRRRQLHQGTCTVWAQGEIISPCVRA